MRRHRRHRIVYIHTPADDRVRLLRSHLSRMVCVAASQCLLSRKWRLLYLVVRGKIRESCRACRSRLPAVGRNLCRQSKLQTRRGPAHNPGPLFLRIGPAPTLRPLWLHAVRPNVSPHSQGVARLVGADARTFQSADASSRSAVLTLSGSGPPFDPLWLHAMRPSAREGAAGLVETSGEHGVIAYPSEPQPLNLPVEAFHALAVGIKRPQRKAGSEGEFRPGLDAQKCGGVTNKVLCTCRGSVADSRCFVFQANG